MKLDKIDVNATLEEAKKLLSKESNVSPALKAMFELLIMIVALLSNRLGLNSRNSSKPPSSDPNRKKKKKRTTTGNKPRGQNGRKGSQLKPVDNPLI